MKISSVSKKVLASALSAAMVVAFAPTVAMGTTTATSATIRVDYSVGSNGTMVKPLTAEILQVMKDDDSKHLVVTPTKTAVYNSDANPGANDEIKSDYAVAEWFIDANGNGLKDSDERTVGNDGTTVLDLTAAGLEGAASVTLTAAYATPNFNAAATYDKDAKALTFGFDKTTAVAGNTYTVEIANPDGVVVASEKKLGSELATSIIAKFGAVVGTGGVTALESFLVSGEYTATIKDGTKTISTKKATLVAATVKVGNAAPVVTMVTKGGTFNLPDNSTSYATYVDANGNYVAPATGGNVTVNADTVYTASKTAAYVTGVAYDEQTRALDFTLNAAFSAGDSLDVKVVSPSGAEIYAASYNSTTGTTVSPISFVQTAANHASAVEEAGTYTVKATFNDYSEADSYTSSATVTLTEIKYVAGEGAKFAKGAVTDVFTDGTLVGGAFTNKDLYDLNNIATADETALGLAAKDGYTANTKAWTLNGAKYDANKNKVQAGKVNTWEVSYKQTTYAAAPTWTVAKTTVGTTDYYVLTVAPAAGTTIYVDGALYTGPVQVNPKQAGGINITGTDGTNAIKAIKLTTGTATLSAWKADTTGASSYLNSAIGNDTAKWVAADGIAKAIAAGTETLTADAAKDLIDDADLTADYNAAAKALYDATAAEADAQLAKYENGAKVVAGDKAYTMTAAKLTAAKKAVAAIKTAVADGNQTAASFTTGVKNLVTTVNAELKVNTDATADKPADIAAAAEVSAQLAAAKTGEEAQAAIEAFNKLTAEQKKLVDAATVASAQKIADEAKAQAELVAAQDDAAVSKARDASKTVKAGKNGKTTKKQSVTLKSITSKSGAKVTYKKSSGSSKISVKSSKAYLAKGVKKGTYKATVKATCGTQTAKIKVTFKVK